MFPCTASLTTNAPTIFRIAPRPVKTAKLRVAAYCRVSTSQAAQLESIRAQKEHYEFICSNHPDWQLTDIYIEEGLSGTSAENRPELIRMIRNCTAGQIDLVITKSISRLARNTTDCLEITRMLSDIGVQVFFEKEQIRTGTMESELMLSILASLAEDESHSISDNNKWNCRNRFRTGTYKFSNVPFGYYLDEDTIMIDPDEAHVVNYIFDEAINGLSCCHIAEKLNEQNIPRRKTSGGWDSAYVNKILRNPFYKGCVMHQKTYTDKRFRTRKNTGQEDRYYISNHHAPIIAPETFDRIQNMLDQKNKMTAAVDALPPEEQLNLTSYSCFTGKLICSCGSNYRRITNGKNRKRYMWSCGRHLRNAKDCPSLRLPEESIQNVFSTMLAKLNFSKKELLIPYIDELNKELELKHPEYQDLLKEELRLQDQMTELKEQRNRGAIHPSVFYSRKNALLALSKELAQKKVSCLSDINYLEEAEQLLHYLDNKTDYLTFDASAFEKFVVYVKLEPVDKVTKLTFFLTCNLAFTETITKAKKH